jgi:hypothetical protein
LAVTSCLSDKAYRVPNKVEYLKNKKIKTKKHSTSLKKQIKINYIFDVFSDD